MPAAVVPIPVDEDDMPVVFIVLVVDMVPVVGLPVVVGEVVPVVVVSPPPEPVSSPQPTMAAETPMEVNKKEKRRIARFMPLALIPPGARVSAKLWRASAIENSRRD